MPQIKSAMKRVKTAQSATLRNASQKSAMRSAIKNFETSAANNTDNKEDMFRTAVRAIDMAKAKGLIKANKAARDKSRLAKLN
ncbi:MULTISPECIES: 30S ribosomal protein S20 [Companilactobacillus]|nr:MULTISPECIES: 30S ribosomal protein S20 [Companilactobacillus]KAE9560219.1 30S ribosomal protein S20 [Companilactobacillus bobalius]KAE9565491.1 30S ribosomal protein S20 [Companilactobacillus paralimentarius]MDR4933780.1 30S ribosomal protein S20 [Companilactobacillus paralimentarius]OVE99383.1 30S ribosomal protein S20 [Companilactobacillus bobalius]QFR70220.1 30S ribosomal protein S20 [Companilactobacillus paralimentarius]